MKLLIPALVFATLATSACSGEDTAKLQQAASTAIGAVSQDGSAPLNELKMQASDAIGQLRQQVKEGSVPVGEIKQQASSAIGIAKRLGEAAIIVNPELKQQVEELKQQASDARAVIKALAP